MKRRILHVTTGLETGGSEMMLFRLLAHTDRRAFDPEVVSLRRAGPVADRIRPLGIRVRELGMAPGRLNPIAIARLTRWIRETRPDVVQTWMYHGDLVGGIAAHMAGGVPVSWGIQNTVLDFGETKWTTTWTVKTCARLSGRIPARIVCCAESARREHAALGYAADRMVVIPNAADLETFHPDPAARGSVRRELGIGDTTPLVGLVARFHPQKDHRTFVEAAARLHRTVPQAHFLLCGNGIDWENPELAEWIDRAGIRDRCHLLGRRDDTPRLIAGLDVATSSSAYGEAFPLVLGEAMACGVPFVATDVGDSALALGDTGVVVPPRDPTALASGWQNLLERSPEQRRNLGMRARQRAEAGFSIGRVASEYERLYDRLASGDERASRPPRVTMASRAGEG